MSGGIYLIQDDGQLVEMTEQAYDSEDLLQGLLAQYPSLLAGDQVNSAVPRRWLLISREMGLPSEEEGGERWSVDHLFLDQDAVPTLVEVKRSSDTRIRREVVGQMFDYAANAVVYWPLETVRTRFESHCEDQQLDPERILDEFLEQDADQEQFWQKVKTNLQAGKVRLVFVADDIPAELRRIVEFLNAQMDPAEVLAVEIKQYVGESMKTLVPRVIGQTEEAQQRKSTGRRETREWNEPSFFEELESERGFDEAKVAQKLLEWGREQMSRIWWGKGKMTGSFYPVLEHEQNWYTLFSVWTDGSVQVQFGTLQSRPPFDNESKRLEFLNRLNKASDIDIPENAIAGKYPSFGLSALARETDQKLLIEALDWAVEEIKRT